jgi:hypothetical protein
LNGGLISLEAAKAFALIAKNLASFYALFFHICTLAQSFAPVKVLMSSSWRAFVNFAELLVLLASPGFSWNFLMKIQPI